MDCRKVYIVMVSIKGGYRAHSVHFDELIARQWQKCKEHDGDDSIIASADADMFTELLELAARQT